MRVREVSGTLVVSLPKKLCENFNIRKGDYVKQTFSKDKIVLKMRRDYRKAKKPKTNLLERLTDAELDKIIREVEREKRNK